MEKETQLKIDELQRQVFSQQDTINDLKQWLRASEIRVSELEKLINSPEINDFIEGFKIEAAHQTERWTQEKEELKSKFTIKRK